jgi:hypothetical protein
MQTNHNLVCWLIIWAALCVLIAWLPAEVTLGAAMALGGINLIMFITTHPTLLHNPLSLLVQVLSSTLVVYGISGVVIESLCRIRSLSGFSILPLSKVCHSSDPYIYGSMILAFASLLGSLACGLLLITFFQRRQ